MSGRRSVRESEPPGIARLTDPRVLASLIADTLNAGTSVRFVASGRSMLPTVRDGDQLTVVPRSQGDLRPGNIALYGREDGGLTAHRILSFTERDGQRALRVRGDASRGAIDVIPTESVLGIVTRVGRGSRDRRVDTLPCRLIGLAQAHLGTWRTRLGLMVRRWAASA